MTEDEGVYWTVFINPFSYNLWFALFCVSMIIAFIFTTTERYFGIKNQGFYVVQFLKNLWIAGKSNFGGKPAKIGGNNSHQMMVFVCLLSGSVIWIGYRASITSELSITVNKLPFNDLESLTESGYR